MHKFGRAKSKWLEEQNIAERGSIQLFTCQLFTCLLQNFTASHVIWLLHSVRYQAGLHLFVVGSTTISVSTLALDAASEAASFRGTSPGTVAGYRSQQAADALPCSKRKASNLSGQ